MSSFALDHARQQWAEGHRRLEAEARAAPGAADLYERVEVVLDELRRRVGQTFTLANLATVYAGSEDWARNAIAERAAGPGWMEHVALVTDAAFHAYARGATDYRP